MPKEIDERSPGPGESVPDISQLTTTWLKPSPSALRQISALTSRRPVPDISQLATTPLKPVVSRTETRDEQIAGHEAEIRRLLELADVVEQAITALVFRLHLGTDQEILEALEHNRADLQRYKDELDSLQTEHQRAIERIQSQES